MLGVVQHSSPNAGSPDNPCRRRNGAGAVQVAVVPFGIRMYSGTPGRSPEASILHSGLSVMADALAP